nr:branched-chain amino acid transport system II carrier protein [Clostridium sp. OM04-12AA]
MGYYFYIIFLYWIQHGAFHYHPILCTGPDADLPSGYCLILLALLGKHFHHDQKVYVWVTALTWAASLFDFFKTLPEQVQILFHLDKAVTLAQTFLPLFNLNLGWILPAMVGMIIGLGCKRNEKRRRQALA